MKIKIEVKNKEKLDIMEIILSLNSEFTIGRGNSDLSLKGASDLSRQHCSLRFDQEPILRVRDLSRNGSFVNGRPIKDSELKVGDTLVIGSCEIKILEIELEAQALAATSSHEEKKSGHSNATAIYTVSPKKQEEASTRPNPPPPSPPPLPARGSAENIPDFVNGESSATMIALALKAKNSSQLDQQVPLAAATLNRDFENSVIDAFQLWKKKHVLFIDLALKQSIVSIVLLAIFAVFEHYSLPEKGKSSVLSSIILAIAVISGFVIWRYSEILFLRLSKTRALLQFTRGTKFIGEDVNILDLEQRLRAIFRSCLLSFEREAFFLESTFLAPLWNFVFLARAEHLLARALLQETVNRNEVDPSKQLRLLCIFAQYQKNLLPWVTRVVLLEVSSFLIVFATLNFAFTGIKIFLMPPTFQLLLPVCSLLGTLLVHATFSQAILLRIFVSQTKRHWVDSQDVSLGWVNTLREMSSEFENFFEQTLRLHQMPQTSSEAKAKKKPRVAA